MWERVPKVPNDGSPLGIAQALLKEYKAAKSLAESWGPGVSTESCLPLDWQQRADLIVNLAILPNKAKE